MNWQQCALAPILLALSSAAHAQVHHGQQGHPGAVPNRGGAVHPGQVHPGGRAMTPEEHMWHQWAQEQWYLNQIMGGSGGSRHRSSGSPGRSNSSKPSQNRPSPSPLNGNAKPAGEPRTKTSPKEKSDAKKTDHKPASSKQKPAHPGANRPTQGRRASDQSIISLLRTTHTRLKEADHDYGGHRVKSMEHITGALRDLGSSTPLGSVSPASAGNLAQSRSDEILRDALFQLRNTETSLGSGTDRAERHHRARSAVAHAISELETALRVR
jgi:hypothetical protein